MDIGLKVLFEQVNDVLAEWNPIGVPPDIAKREYTTYVWQIIGCLQRGEDMCEYLQSALSRMGLQYDKANPDHRDNLQLLCNQLASIYPKK